MCVSVGEIRGRDQLAVSGSLRWFPVSERRKSRCLCVRIYIFFFFTWFAYVFIHVFGGSVAALALCGRPAAWL